MGKTAAFIIVALSALIYLQFRSFLEVPPLPEVKDTWWGAGDPTKEDTKIHPFKINVSDDILKDLERRLANALPFQEPLENAKHHYGINSNLLKKIVDFWKTKYNWRVREKFLNQFPQYKVSVQGLKIHYIHVKPNAEEAKGKKVIPLLILHGWPGSVREFYEILPLLTKPQSGKDFVFEVIAPSLPGYGFSDPAVRPGLNPIEMANIFKNFMKRIGFDKYYIQGGDWGAIIVKHMAILYPDHVIGVHANMCSVSTPLSNLKLFLGTIFPSLVCTKEEEPLVYPLSKKFKYLLLESGYMHLQATKPDTVGVALRESPVGLAAYILEKFITWTNPTWKDLDDGGLEKKFTYEQLLDNVMIYWVTRSITTSMRLYSETFHRFTELQQNPVEIPSACAKFPYELTYQPDTILKEMYINLIQSNKFDDGGHFASFELPDVVADDIYSFVEKVEKLPKSTNKK